jgi:hypothetical protein
MVAAIAIIGLFAPAVQAAEDSSKFVTELPETHGHLKAYLFMLKDSKISLSPVEFCRTMDYGEPVLFRQPNEIEDKKIVPGKLEWVICRFKPE